MLLFRCSVVSDSLQTMDCNLPDSSVHGISLGKNTGLGCYFLFQVILPVQGSILHLLQSSRSIVGFFTTESLGKPQCRFFFCIKSGQLGAQAMCLFVSCHI